jgi:hypothetical protein
MNENISSTCLENIRVINTIDVNRDNIFVAAARTTYQQRLPFHYSLFKNILTLYVARIYNTDIFCNCLFLGD